MHTTATGPPLRSGCSLQSRWSQPPKTPRWETPRLSQSITCAPNALPPAATVQGVVTVVLLQVLLPMCALDSGAACLLSHPAANIPESFPRFSREILILQKSSCFVKVNRPRCLTQHQCRSDLVSAGADTSGRADEPRAGGCGRFRVGGGPPSARVEKSPSGVVRGEEREGHGCQNGKGFRAADVLDLAAQRSQHPSWEF